MPRVDRRVAERRGHAAEFAACWLLRLKGYRILGRRVKTPMGEIDIVARRGRTTAFVEVKARPNPNEALESLGLRQGRRTIAAAKYWVAARAAETGDCRFDIIVVSPYLWARHLPNAFAADL
jgi:putative endonuclease